MVSVCSFFFLYFHSFLKRRQEKKVAEEAQVQRTVKVLCSTVTKHWGSITSSMRTSYSHWNDKGNNCLSPFLECKRGCKWTTLKVEYFLGGLNTWRASLQPSCSHTFVWYHRAQWVTSSVISTCCLWQLGYIGRRYVMWSHTVPWCVGLTRGKNKGVGLDTRERRLGGSRRSSCWDAAEVVCVNNWWRTKSSTIHMWDRKSWVLGNTRPGARRGAMLPNWHST